MRRSLPLKCVVASCIAVFLWLYPGNAQAQQHNFTNWTLEQGLPQSQVNHIIQDQEGQLWVATLGGVSRFDGSRFRTYSKKQGLSSNNIRCLFQDSRKHIWVGTADNGLVRYSNNTFQKYGPADGLPAGGIHSVAEDATGKVWLATDNGIYTFEQGSFTRYTKLPDQPYTAIRFGADGTLWAGTAANGLYMVSNRGNTVQYTPGNSALPGNTVTCLLPSPDGTTWVGTNNGIARYSQGTFSPQQLPATVTSLYVTAITRDSYNNTWIGLKNSGLVQYSKEGAQHITTSNGLSTDKVLAVEADIEGNIWVGTQGHGLQQYKSPWFVHYTAAGSNPKITALAKDKQGTVWIGTENGSVGHLQQEELKWLNKPSWPAGTTVNNICVPRENDVWVATNNGVWNLKQGNSKHYGQQQGLPSKEVYQCVTDGKGNIWVATAAGVAFLNNGIFQEVKPADGVAGKTYFVHQDAQEKLWVGSSQGLYLLEEQHLRPLPELSSFNFKEVTTVAEDGDGTLYFGAYNYGIVAYNPNWQQPKLMTEAHGLPNEGIRSLHVDNAKNLWIGTSNGVAKIPIDQVYQNQDLHFRHYTMHDGFSGLEVNHNTITETPDGSIWFGTAKGLTQYIPALDKVNKVHPKPILTSIMLALKPTDWESMGYRTHSGTGIPLNLRLPYHQNYLTFDFKAVCLTVPDQIRYRYRLLGYEDAWSDVSEQSFATYPNLEPGNYTFQLVASNNNGYWTPQPLTYAFAIAPPIWRREWFIGVLLLVLASTVISMVRLREKNLLKMNTLLEQRVRHRTQLLEEKNFEKEVLLKEVHHRVKNNLQIVISMLNLQARHLNDPHALEVMQALKNRVRSMALLHERLYQHDDLSRIGLYDYFQGVCESLYASYGVTTQQVHLNLAIPPIKVDIDSAITLGLIVNELVSNALKYAFQGNTGKLEIELKHLDNQNYLLTVADNGKGLPPDFETRIQKSFGLQLVSSLGKKLNGTIQHNTSNGTKSIFYFVLPS